MLKFYKMKYLLLTTALLLLTVQSLWAQVQRPPAEKFDTFIAEVYTGEGAAEIAPDTRRYAYMKKLYTERIVYSQVNTADIAAKGYLKLSTVPLCDVYNKNLKRDTQFNVATFNPFKYYIDLYSRGTQIFVIDGTNTVISIYPQHFKQ